MIPKLSRRLSWESDLSAGSHTVIREEIAERDLLGFLLGGYTLISSYLRILAMDARILFYLSS